MLCCQRGASAAAARQRGGAAAGALSIAVSLRLGPCDPARSFFPLSLRPSYTHTHTFAYFHIQRRSYIPAAGMVSKRMNLFTAINDALRIALEKDSSAVGVCECVCA